MKTRFLKALRTRNSFVAVTACLLSVLFDQQNHCFAWTISGYPYCNGGSPAIYLYWSRPSTNDLPYITNDPTVYYTIYRNGSYYAGEYTQTSFDNTANVATGGNYTYA